MSPASQGPLARKTINITMGKTSNAIWQGIIEAASDHHMFEAQANGLVVGHMVDWQTLVCSISVKCTRGVTPTIQSTQPATDKLVIQIFGYLILRWHLKSVLQFLTLFCVHRNSCRDVTNYLSFDCLDEGYGLPYPMR